MLAKKISLALLRCLVFLMLLALLTVGGLAIWLGTAPREIPFAQNFLIKAITKETLAKEATMQPPLAYFNRKNMQMELALNELHIKMAGGEVAIDEMRLSAPFKYLLRQEIGFDTLLLDQITIAIDGNESLSIPSFAIKPEKGNLKVTHVKLDLTDMREGALIEGDLLLGENNITFDAELTDVPASLLALAHVDAKGLKGDVNGWAHVTMGNDFTLRYAALENDITALSFAHDVMYPEPLTVDKVHIEGDWKRTKNEVKLSALEIIRNNTRVNATGVVRGSNISVDADIANVPVNDLDSIWPVGKAAEARAWVTTHLFDGTVDTGKVLFSQDVTATLPTLDAQLQVRDMRVRYAPHLPQIHKAKGKVALGLDDLHVTLDYGKTLENTHLKSGIVEVKSFAKGAAPMDIWLDLDGTAKDVATFISPKHLNKAAALKLKPNSIKGEVKGKVHLNFPLHPQRAGLGKSSFDNLTLDIKADIANMTQNGVLGDLDVKGFGGTVALDNNQVQLVAKGMLHDTPASIDVTHIYGNKREDTNYTISLEVPDTKLDVFKIPLPKEHIQGVTKLNASIKDSKGVQHIDATLDFKDARVFMDDFGWSKPRGTAAKATIKQVVNAKASHITALDFTSDNMKASGDVLMDTQGGLIQINLPVLRFNGNDLSLRYKHGVQPDITLSGKRLVIPASERGSANNQQESVASEDTNPFAFLMNRKLHVALDQLVKDKLTLRNVSLNSSCNNALCESLALKADYLEKDVLHATIKHGTPKRALHVEASNFGALLNRLDIYEHMRGGALTFDGIYEDGEPLRPVQGRALVKNMVIRGAPAMAKMLTLASLRGITDTLAGKGIAFSKTSANVHYDGTRFRFSKGSAKGDAMGILAEGELKPYGAASIDLKGTVIPSYTLNSLPGKVPIIGKLLVGGKDEGVFGTKFSMRGALDDPQVIVNPLSMLTPGFLRNIFDVFPDSKPPEKPKR